MSLFSKTWRATAPSNIAITKYMGKKDSPGNYAINPSLSMTLTNFTTEVSIEQFQGNQDSWQPFPGEETIPEAAQNRFLNFFKKLKSQLEFQNQTILRDHFILRSRNNFPRDCGLASSASSFAALTKVTNLCFTELYNQPLAQTTEGLARISKTGSGSSARSFFSPWCAWEGENIFPLASKLTPLSDLVVVLNNQPKKFSSSEAHKRVQSSPLFLGRETRVTERQTLAKNALETGNFRALAEIAWLELWEMHSMFHTSSPPFFYFEPTTLQILRWVESLWEENDWGPIATVDAGPNVHLLIPTSEQQKLRHELEKILPKGVSILETNATEMN